MNIPRSFPQQFPIDPQAPVNLDPEPVYIFHPSDLPYDDNERIT